MCEPAPLCDPEFARLTPEVIAGLPVRRYTGPIHHVRTQAALQAVISELKNERVLGFDTETRPAFKPGEKYMPSLLQLATAESVVLCYVRDIGIPACLRELLGDAGTVKAGLAPGEDVRQLVRLSAFEPAGFVDLGMVARTAGMKHHGLVGICAVLFGFRVSKGARRSNWARSALTPAQIDYAATDAWASRLIYLEFERRGWTGARKSR